MKNVLVSLCLLGARCRYDGRSKPVPLSVPEDWELVPVCPEQLGGLPTPRVPAEIRGERVMTRDGRDVTAEYRRGAEEALKIAEIFHCDTAILKENSPSCGCGGVYDGSFTKTLISSDGITASLLKAHGIRVLGESKISTQGTEANRKTH